MFKERKKLDLCYIINGFIHQNGGNWQIKQFSPFLWHTKLPLLQVHGLALPFLETVSFLDEETESSLISYPLTNFCPTQTCQVPLSQGATFFDILQRPVFATCKSNCPGGKIYL